MKEMCFFIQKVIINLERNLSVYKIIPVWFGFSGFVWIPAYAGMANKPEILNQKSIIRKECVFSKRKSLKFQTEFSYFNKSFFQKARFNCEVI